MDAIQTGMSRIAAMQGVEGVALLRGDILVFNQMPLADRFAGELAGEIHAMFSGYGSVGRKVTKLFVSFGQIWFTVVGHGDARVAIMTQPGADLDATVGAADRFIREHFEAILAGAPAELAEDATPVDGLAVWKLRGAFVQIMTKVIGQAQAARMVDRELEKARQDDAAMIPRAAAEAASRRILDRVPNRSRRTSLAEEFAHVLKTI